MTHDLAVPELPTPSHAIVAVELLLGARAGLVPAGPTRPPGVPPNCTCGEGLPGGSFPCEGHPAQQGGETQHGSHEEAHAPASWQQSALGFGQGRGQLCQRTCPGDGPGWGLGAEWAAEIFPWQLTESQGHRVDSCSRLQKRKREGVASLFLLQNLKP